MKKFTEFIIEGKIEFENTINYINVNDLNTYLKVANKFISQDAKDIINWLIVNNSSYVSDLTVTGKYGNALIDFYNNGVPKDEHLKELYKKIGNLYKINRLLEIPVLLTADQFNSIINKEISPDEILLDLHTERGRDKVAKQYTPLVYKIVKQRLGKSTATFDDLLSAGFEGLAYAMKHYGKKTMPDFKNEETGIEIDMSRKKALTFLTYASACIYNHIVGWAENDSHIVRIPKSMQSTLKKETGSMIRQATVSGEQKVGKKSDNNEGKTLFDYIGGEERDAAYKLDMEDCEKLWGRAKKKLLEEFDKKTIDIFCSFYGLWNYEKLKNKDLAKKYNCATSNITAITRKVLRYINTNKEMKSMFNDIWELMKESLHDYEVNNNDDFYTIKPISNCSDVMRDTEDELYK